MCGQLRGRTFQINTRGASQPEVTQAGPVTKWHEQHQQKKGSQLET